jgi:hypothetical protein
MKAKAFTERLAFFGVLRQLCEQLHLDGAQERLRRPEADANLHDVLGRWVLAHDPSFS